MKKFFSLFVALIPLLGSYSSGLPGISIADIFLLFFIVFLPFLSKKRDQQNISGHIIVWIFLTYTILNSLICSIAYNNYCFDILTRTTRLCFYIWFSFFIVKKFLDISLFIKYSTRIAILCGIYVFFQYILFYSTGRMITGVIPFLRPYSAAQLLENLFRPAGFFMEPSALVWYMFPLLNFKLLDNDHPISKKNLFIICFITLLIIMSKSLYGLVMTGVIWGAYFTKLYFGKHKKNLIGLFLLLAIIPIVFYIMLKSNIVQEALKRIDFNDIVNSPAFSGRFLQYELFQSLNVFQKFLGIGIGNLMGYENINNFVAYILCGNGIIGLIIVLTWYSKSLKNNKSYAKKLFLICFFLIALGSNLFLSSSLIFMTSFLQVNNNLKKKSK